MPCIAWAAISSRGLRTELRWRTFGRGPTSFVRLARQGPRSICGMLKISADSTEAEMLSALCHFEQSTLIRVHRPPLARELALLLLKRCSAWSKSILTTPRCDTPSRLLWLWVPLVQPECSTMKIGRVATNRRSPARQHSRATTSKESRLPISTALNSIKKGAIFIRQERFEQGKTIP